jgi:hypothetical protein
LGDDGFRNVSSEQWLSAQYQSNSKEIGDWFSSEMFRSLPRCFVCHGILAEIIALYVPSAKSLWIVVRKKEVATKMDIWNCPADWRLGGKQ